MGGGIDAGFGGLTENRKKKKKVQRKSKNQDSNSLSTLGFIILRGTVGTNLVPFLGFSLIEVVLAEVLPVIRSFNQIQKENSRICPQTCASWFETACSSFKSILLATTVLLTFSHAYRSTFPNQCCTFWKLSRSETS